MNTRRTIARLVQLFERLDLQHDRDHPEAIVAALERDVEFRGVNLWVLICAVLVASVGLNVNSTAVIIGAMLISPLMGPIIGIGVSLATYDVGLLKKSSKNFGVAVIFSVLTSALYFTLSPLKEPQSELIARTSPTLWDVLIAFFGGLAGIIASTSREKKFTVIAGVAIATALMPPLCTVGYGLAIREWSYFFGALYLFTINTVFISTAAYTIAQLLRFPNRMGEAASKQRVRRIVFAVVLATVLPSIYLAWRVVNQTINQQRIQQFVHTEFQLPHTTVVNYRIKKEADSSVLEIVLFGDLLDSAQIAERRLRLPSYGLEHMRVEVMQGGGPAISTENLRTAVLEDFYQKTERKLQQLEDSLHIMEQTLLAYRTDENITEEIAREISVLFPEIKGIAARQIVLRYPTSFRADTVMIVLFDSKELRSPRKQQFERWLRTRMRRDNIRLIAF